MYYPSIQDFRVIVARLNQIHNINVNIINKGQLDFALEKPKMNLFGNEQYPKLYQKAAILMSTLTKSHVLSDGNKRCAIMMAEFMVKVNGAELMLPLKTINLSVDTAMDDKDILTKEIEQWFKTHIAENSNQLSIMLREHMEENSIIIALLQQKRYSDAGKLVSKWMSFDSYPEHETAWNIFVEEWKIKSNDMNSNSSNAKTIWNIINWTSQYNEIKPDYRHMTITAIEDLSINGHTVQELKNYEKKIQAQEQLMTNMNIYALYYKSITLQQFGRMQESLHTYDDIITRYPSETHAYCYRGILHSLADESKKALSDFQKCGELSEKYDEKNMHTHIREYIVYEMCRLKKYDQAILECNKNINNNPDRSISYFVKSLCLEGKGKLDDAEKAVKKALNLFPNNTSYITHYGNVLFQKGDYQKSIEEYQQVINKKPDLTHARYNLAFAQSQSQTNQINDAKENYKIILKQNPNHMESLINYSVLLSNNEEYEMSLQLLHKALELDPLHEIALLNAGITYTKIVDYEKATQHIDKVLQHYPKNIYAMYCKSSILTIQHKIDIALEWIEKTINKDNNTKMKFQKDPTFESVRSSDLFKKLTS